MSKLIFTALTSLDGYIEDGHGRFDWAVPDAEVHTFINDLEATVGTHLYGRRMYETMAAWQTVDESTLPAAEAEYAKQWRALDKVVYSRTLDSIWTPHTRLEHALDLETVAHLKATADRAISISGPGLAQHAFRAGLVDETHLFVFPVIVGGGKPGLPHGVQLNLALLDERRFGNGVIHLHHRIRPTSALS